MANSQYTFSYENAQWLDLLTKVSYKALNGTTTTRSLTYDAIGNPLTYFNGLEEWNFTWSEGRRLKSAVTADGETTITNTYDVDGIRETKQVGNVVHNYVTLDGKVIRESYGTTTIDYLYDNDGRPYQITVDLGGTKYVGYYVLNQQGDVIALVDEEGAVVTTYVYNAWGKVINYSTSGDGSKLYTYNALTYRGYYYDKDLGMYYLNSRYYDPQIGRFISADAQLNSSTGLLGYNMFAYCNNNPVNMSDSSGNWPKWVEKAAKVVSGVVVVAAVVVTVSAVSAFTAGTGSAAAVYGASIFLGAALSGINGAVANSKKGNSYFNGYVGGATGGAIQSAASKTYGGTVIGGSVGVTVGTAVTDTLNNLDPDSKNTSKKQMLKNATTSGMKALVTSSITAYAGYSADLARMDGAGGLMPSFTYGFGEGYKAFFGWADDAIIYLWE